MIQSMPRDFNPTGYDLKTTDGTIWKIVEFEDHFELQSEAGNFGELMKLDGRFTVFAPGYRNINLHGFEVAGTQYELGRGSAERELGICTSTGTGEALYAKEAGICRTNWRNLQPLFRLILLPAGHQYRHMLQAAQQAGATETEIANASAILLALAKDVEG